MDCTTSPPVINNNTNFFFNNYLSSSNPEQIFDRMPMHEIPTNAGLLFGNRRQMDPSTLADAMQFEEVLLKQYMRSERNNNSRRNTMQQSQKKEIDSLDKYNYDNDPNLGSVVG